MFEAKSVQCVVAGCAAVGGFCGVEQRGPEFCKVGFVDEKFCAGNTAGRTANEFAGEAGDGDFAKGKIASVRARSTSANFATRLAAPGPSSASVPKCSDSSASVTSSMMMNLSRAADELFANHRVGNAEECVRLGVGFNFSLDAALRVKKRE